MIISKANLFASLITIMSFFTFFISSVPIEAKTDLKKPKANLTTPQKKWAVIEGFRSAKFGMDEKQVSRAIRKDFNISSSKIKRKKDSLRDTVSLEISVPKLFQVGGGSTVGYIFGSSSKKLIQVNVGWGFGSSKVVDGQSVVDAANLLRDHFTKKRYNADSMIANGTLNETTIIVFRGVDKKGRMALLTLSQPLPQKGESKKDASKRISLLLSYIADHDKPDVLTIKDGDF
jgi:hypothetical protein